MTPVQLSGDDVAAIIASMSKATFVGCFLAAALGRLAGQTGYNFLHLYLVRRPSWRRFQRALGKYFARSSHEKV